jgi:uncharacterized protein YbaA (DUF1428 family)
MLARVCLEVRVLQYVAAKAKSIPNLKLTDFMPSYKTKDAKEVSQKPPDLSNTTEAQRESIRLRMLKNTSDLSRGAWGAFGKK